MDKNVAKDLLQFVNTDFMYDAYQAYIQQEINVLFKEFARTTEADKLLSIQGRVQMLEKMQNLKATVKRVAEEEMRK